MRKLFKKAVCITSAITIGISGTWMMPKTVKAEEPTVQETTIVQETTTQPQTETTKIEQETSAKEEETTVVPKPVDTTKKPGTPVRLSASTLSSHVYLLKWTGEADGFIVRVYDINGKLRKRVKTSKNEYKLYATPDCNYIFTVQGYNRKKDGSILYSNRSEKKSFGLVKKLVAPTIVSTYKQSDGKKFSLRWKATDRATYYVQRYNTQKKSWITLKVIKSNRATVSTKANATYKFRVVAKKYVNRKLTRVAGAGKWYGTYTFAPVKLIDERMIGDTSISCSWKPKKGTIRYNVYLKTGKNGAWEKIDVLKSNPKTGIKTGYLANFYVTYGIELRGGQTYYLRMAPVCTVRGKAYLGKMSNIITLKLPYTETDRQKDYIDKEINRMVKAANLNSKMTDAEKATRLMVALGCYMKNGYDWDKYHQIMNGTYEYKSFDIYDALKKKKGVCEDYANIAYRLLNRNNITTKYVSNYLAGHTWNLVKLDGRYYILDVTGANNENSFGGGLIGRKKTAINIGVTSSSPYYVMSSHHTDDISAWKQTNHDYYIDVVNTKRTGLVIKFGKGTSKTPYKTIKRDYLYLKF